MSKSLNDEYNWQGLRLELWMLWHLDGWFWYNSKVARFLTRNIYHYRNLPLWCRVLDRHVCTYRPGCRGNTTLDKKFIVQLRSSKLTIPGRISLTALFPASLRGKTPIS